MLTATQPGNQTSEYKVTVFATFLSTLATIVGFASSILDVLPPSIKWVGPATAIVGLLTTMFTALGYQTTRAAVKSAALKAATEVPTATPNNAAANLARAA